jgi:hypothetical protein
LPVTITFWHSAFPSQSHCVKTANFFLKDEFELHGLKISHPATAPSLPQALKRIPDHNAVTEGRRRLVIQFLDQIPGFHPKKIFFPIGFDILLSNREKGSISLSQAVAYRCFLSSIFCIALHALAELKVL